MTISRRVFGVSLASAGLAACVGGGSGSRSGGGGAARSSGGLPPEMRPQPNAGWDAWVASFQGRARAAGIAQSTLDASFRGAGFLPGVIKRDRNQTEFKRSLEDYLSIAVSDKRLSMGRANFARYGSVLRALEAKYGVDAEIICAIWGLESQYGTRMGDIPIISSTSTLAFEGRRGAFFEKQLIAALRIVQNGDIPASRMVGSWAGAMGHTQFIPTSYQAFAVDFTGDGRRDIWSADPSDALASTAAYLSRNGWSRGLRWGGEVGAPGTPAGRTIQPQPGGPQFAVTGNFNAIKRYNNSDSYAIGVGHLADRIAGRGALRSSFPPDANGLTKDDRIALQKGLTRRGYDTGGADGILGPKSQAAVRAYQEANGLEVTGRPSQALLRGL